MDCHVFEPFQTHTIVEGNTLEQFILIIPVLELLFVLNGKEKQKKIRSNYKQHFRLATNSLMRETNALDVTNRYFYEFKRKDLFQIIVYSSYIELVEVHLLKFALNE